MRLSRLPIALALVLAFAAAPGGALLEQPAAVRSFGAGVERIWMRTLDSSLQQVGTTEFVVASRTGNCCENYLASTAAGRLVDMGSDFPRYTDDGGLTWREVVPQSPFLGAEGAIAVAPNGDVVGMTWDPYTGDRVVSYKYEAANDRWLSAEVPMHGPAFDRPWLAVVPGPFEWGSFSGEYLTVMRGGAADAGVVYVSFDGLTYVRPSVSLLDTHLDSTPVPYSTGADWWLDWVQPHASSGMVPLPGRDALYADAIGCNYATTRADLSWRCSTMEPGLFGDGILRIDSLGRLHRVNDLLTQVVYELSSDAGQTWERAIVELPQGMAIEDLEFKANGVLGLGAIAIHAHDASTATDQDLLLEIDVAGAKPALRAMHLVGAGDENFGAGVGSSLRFDFANVAILPDGRIATSFVDAAHRSPAIAVRR